MTPTHPNNIALHIDADNPPAGEIGFIPREPASRGVVNICRASGNRIKPDLAGPLRVPHEHLIRPLQDFDLITGRNAHWLPDRAQPIAALNPLRQPVGKELR